MNSQKLESIIREYIDKSLHMSLATVGNDRPWVCEVHFVYDESLNLYFRSLSSRRHSKEIENNPRVAGNIVRQHTIDEYPHAIYFEGTARKLKTETQLKGVLSLFEERLNASKDILDEAMNDDGHQFYAIKVENWYAFGKFDEDKGQKHKLPWNE